MEVLRECSVYRVQRLVGVCGWLQASSWCFGMWSKGLGASEGILKLPKGTEVEDCYEGMQIAARLLP